MKVFISYKNIDDEDLHGQNVLLLTVFGRCFVKCSKYLKIKSLLP